MKNNEVELGREVESLVTGFRGILMGYVVYLSGCNQCLVMPKVSESGDNRESIWIDIQCLKYVGTEKIIIDNGNTPGASIPPKKESPMLGYGYKAKGY